MKTIRLIAFRLVLLLGWASLLTCTTLLAVEQSGLAERWLRSALSERLGDSGATIAIEHVDFDWLEPGVELRGISLTGARELLRAERLHLAIGLTSGLRPYLARVEVERGRLLLGESLRQLSPQFVAGPPAEAGSARAPLGPLPAMQVRAFDVELELGPEDAVPLARIDLSVEPHSPQARAGTAPLASGRITLPAAEHAGEGAQVHFVGRLRDERWIDWTASAEALAIESVRLPASGDFEGLRDLSPTGLFDVDCEATLDLEAPLALTGDLRLRAREVSLEVRRGCAPIVEGTLDLAARLDATRATPVWDPDAWMAGARLSARWNGYGLRAGARLGSIARPGTRVEVWARVPGLPMSPELVELFGRAPFIANPYEALKPDGEFDVTLGAHLRDGWSAPASLLPHLEFCAELQSAGRLSAEWLGVPPDPGKPRVAFPMPTRARSVRASYARTERFPRPEFLGVHFVGDHASGSVDVRYYSWSPPVDLAPFVSTKVDMEEEVHIHSDGVAVDPALHRALGGLAELPGVADVWDTYQPAGGRIAVDLRLADRAQLPRGPAGSVHLALVDCGACWRELPAPVSSIDGPIRYATDGFGRSSITFALEGELASAPLIRLQGQVREEAGADELAPAEGIALDVLGIDLRGADREVVAATLPEVGEALATFGPTGRADVHYRRARPRKGDAASTRLEVRPQGELVLEPRDFPLAARGVRGRVVSESSGSGGSRSDAPGREPSTMTSIAPLMGDWPGGALVALDAGFPAGGPGRIEVFGSGLAPADASFLEELRAALPADFELPAEGALEPGRFAGALDFVSRFETGAGEDAAAPVHRFLLRRNDLTLREGQRVREVDGELELSDGRLASEYLAGVIGSTRVELAGASARIAADGVELSTRLSTSGFRLDREHLSPFLDEPALDALLGSFGLRGRVDVPSGELSFQRDRAGHTLLRLRGDLALTDVFVDFGLPIAVGSALGRVEELVIEDGHARWRATLDDLYGRLLGRELGPVRVLASSYGSRLSIESLEGTFARGTLGGLDRSPSGGAQRDRAGPVLTVDLEPPHSFGLGLELVDADVAVLLKDLFPDGIASRGRLTTRLQLDGELTDLLSIRGQGFAEVLESRLWSIPVFRDLLARLGLEAGVVFDEMRCVFDVRDAVIRMHEAEVRSPFLKLVGEGELDLDGSLRYDLRVHYSALDKVRLVREIVYLVQSSLVSVTIRGDMSRPVVLMRGSLSRLFNPIPDEYRRLPLPPYSRLPERF